MRIYIVFFILGCLTFSSVLCREDSRDVKFHVYDLPFDEVDEVISEEDHSPEYLPPPPPIPAHLRPKPIQEGDRM